VRAKHHFLAVFVLAFVTRCLYLFEMQDTPLFEVLMGDARGYDDWARRIATGDWLGERVFYQAPFYPYFIAAVYKLTGQDVTILRGIQILIGSFSCVFVALAGRRFFSVEVGLLAGVILAVYPPAIFFDLLIQKAVLGMFFTALLLLLLGRVADKVSGPELVLTGAVLGVFALTRENALALYGLVVLWLFLYFRKQPLSARLRWVAAFSLGVSLILVPVGLRNMSIGGNFLLTTSQAGPNFFIGNNLKANGQYRPLKEGRGKVDYELEDARELAEAEVGRSLSPAEVSRYWLNRSLAYIREHPGHWFELMLLKWLWVWNARELMDTESIELYRDASALLRLLGVVAHFGVLVPLAAVGMWTSRNEWRRLWLLHGFLIGFAATVALFYVFARYRVPMIPLLALFAAVGVLAITETWQRRDIRRLGAYVVTLLAAAAVSNWPLTPLEDPRAIGYHNLGQALMDQGRQGEAMEQLERGLRARPHSAALNRAMGRALSEVGSTEQAAEHFARALATKPGDVGAHTGLGTLLARTGALDQAEEHYLQALESEPDNANIIINLGNVKLLQGRTDEAIALYTRALAIEPAGLKLHLNLAIAYVAEGDSEAAIAHYRRALEIEPQHPDAHLFLADLLVGVGRLEEAREHYEATLRIQPEHTGAREKLARLRVSE
jgi:tetratricopeptide (TPR) repeat protein